MSVELPCEFGPYVLTRQIGRGGMGVVFEGHDPSLNRQVAIKILSPAAALSPRSVERFYREARAAAKLRHPSIVSVYQFGEAMGQVYLVMDYVEGETLQTCLARGMSSWAAVRIVRQIAEALQCAHEQGIVHRDVKPGNILIDRDGNPYLTDFGIAHDASRDHDLTGEGEMVGSVLYMAPEQMRSDGEVGPPADVYALGSVLYEAVTGKPPFIAQEMIGVVGMKLTQRAVPPRKHKPRLHAGLERIIMSCLERDPAGRPESAGALARQLDEVIQKRHVVEMSSLGGVAAVRANPAVWLAAAGAVALFVLVFLAVTWLAPPPGKTAARAPDATPAPATGQPAGAPAPPGDADPRQLARARELVRQGELALGRAGGHDGALVQADAALELAPTLAEAHVLRARALTRQRMRAEALSAWQHAFEADPTVPLEHLYTALDRARPELRASFRGWIAPVGAHEDPLLARLAQAIALRHDRTEASAAEALAILDDVLWKNPDHKLARRERAITRWRLCRWEEALQDADQLVSRWPEDGVHRLIRGRFLMYRNELDEAFDELALARRQRIDLVEPLVETGLLELRRFRLEDARHAFETARSLAPDAARPLAGMALVQCYRAMMTATGLQDQAFRASVASAQGLAEQALTLEPEDADTRAVLAFTHYLEKDPIRAVAEAKHSIETDPQSHFGYRTLLMALAVQKRRAELDDYFAQWVQRCPWEPEPYLSRGEALVAPGDFDAAAPDFARARELAPDSGDVLIRVARYYMGRVIRDDMEAARHLPGLVAELRARHQRLFEDFCAFTGIDPKMLDRAEHIVANNVEFAHLQPIMDRALAALEREDAAEAERLLLSAIDPPNPLPHIHLVTRVYVNPDYAAKLGKAPSDMRRLMLEHARTAIELADGRFTEWQPISNFAMALAHLENGELDQAALYARTARGQLGRPANRPDLDEEAERLISRVERMIARARRGGR